MFEVPLAISGALALFGGFMVKKGISAWKFYSKIRNLSTSKIKSLAAGEVEIKGTVLEGKGGLLVSPVKKIPCVSYNLKCYKWVKRGKSSNWSLLYEKSESKPFYLSDETGFLLVNPEGAIVRNDTFSSEQSASVLPGISIPGLSEKISESIKEATGKEPSKQELEGATGLLKAFSATSGRYKFDEICVPKGEKVYVLGYTVESQENLGPNVQRLAIAKVPGKDYVITDEKEEDFQGVHFANLVAFLGLGLGLVFFGLIQISNILDWTGFIGGFG